jgi:defect-in-organelle-trafficking protein DotD
MPNILSNKFNSNKFNGWVIAVLVFSFFISSCTTQKSMPRDDAGKAQTSLAEASYSVSRSLVDLAETAQAAHPLPDLPPPPSPDSYGMGGFTSVDWSGPVEPLVRQIARAADYRVRILGTAPGIPVLVTVYQKNAVLGDILRDIGYQCGRRATVIVFPENRVIELRYAKN